MATLDLAQTHGASPAIVRQATDGAPLLVQGEALATLQRKGLSVSGAYQQGRLVLRLAGKLDATTAPLLKRLLAAGGEALHLDLDLAGCGRIDGVGLATLGRLAVMLTADGGSLRAVNVPSAMRRTMARVNLHHLLDIIEATPGEGYAGLVQ